METSDPATGRGSRQYVGGVLAGTGAGLGLATVIYKHFPGAETRDWVTIVAFILLALGGFYARYARPRGTTKPRTYAE